MESKAIFGLKTIFLVITTSVVVCSCFTSKAVKTLKQGHQASMLKEYTAFVVTNGNDTIQGTKWDAKYKKGNWFVVLDGKRYIDTSIKAFQNDAGFAHRYRSAQKAHSFIDQWAYYARRGGKIDVLTYNNYLGASSSSDRYEFSICYAQANQTNFKRLTREELKNIIKGNAAATALFDQSKVPNRMNDEFGRKALAIIDVYNSTN